MSKIAVVTLQFGNLPYFEYSTRINRHYCQRHGYDFLMTSPDDPPAHDRDPIWYKVRRVADLLPSYDFVLFLDADAWFYDQERRIEDLIAQHMRPETLLLFGTDRRDKDFAWNDNDANVGVFLVRHTPLARHILEEWWAVPIYDLRTAKDWPIEQRAFNWHIRPRWYDQGRIKTIDYHFLNGLDGEYIRHLAGEPREVRTAVLREVAERLMTD